LLSILKFAQPCELSRNTNQPIDSVGCAVRTNSLKMVRAAHPTVFLRYDLRLRADYFANQSQALS